MDGSNEDNFKLSDHERIDLEGKVQSLLLPTINTTAMGDKESIIIMDSIRYFINLPSMSILLHDWLHDESTAYNAIAETYPNYVIPKPLWRDFILRLCAVSRSLHYLHSVATHTNNYDLMLSTACKALKTFQMTLHEDMRHDVPECISLCTFFFKYALQTKH